MSKGGGTYEVGIVSWPPLWQYWPAYLALARTEKRFSADGLSFRFLPTVGQTTDEKLRADFFARIHAEPSKPFLALCEPRETLAPLHPSGPADDSGVLGRRTIIQRLPLIWRQPHWVLSNGQTPAAAGALTPEGPGKLWRYPQATTSGDFVAHAIGRLVMFESFDGVLCDLTEDLVTERDLVRRGLGPADMVVTFTPWHLILRQDRGPRAAEDDWATEHRLDATMLPGPSRDVTALQVPDQGNDLFVRYLAAQIKSVIAELGATQGEAQLIEAFFADETNFETVQAFLKRSGHSPVWLDRAFLSPALAEYVRLGCYFPYRTIDSAISAENAWGIFSTASVGRP